MRARLLACVLAAAPLQAGAAVPLCPQVAATIDFADLSHLAAALKPGGTLNVLAVGSATLFGPASDATADATRKPTGAPPLQAAQSGFPWQAAHALEATVPGLHVNVTIIGRRGISADDMVLLMRRELSRQHYRLVLWQTGTVEAVQESSPEDFYQTLSDGAALAAAAGADLVLIDPQYSRFLSANANMEPYLGALQAAAALPGVGLFHRFDLMRSWVESGAIDLERAPKADRQAIAVRLHACLGRELARELLGAVPQG